MAQPNSQSHSGNAHTTPATTPGRCPICDGTELTQIVATLPPVCTDCGAVIADDALARVPTQALAEPSDQPTNAAWSKVVSVRNATEQRVGDAFATIETIAKTLGLTPAIRAQAAQLYCDGLRAETTDGRETAAVVAAAVRYASIECDSPIPTRRVADAADTTARHCRQALSALSADCSLTPGVQTPTEYLPFLVRDLNLHKSAHERAATALETAADASTFTGKHPAGVAAAAIYTVTTNHTQADVAAAAGVSAETIRKRLSQFEASETNV